METYLLFDIYNLIYRGNAALQVKNDDMPLSAVYGALLTMRHCMKKFDTKKIIAAYDSPLTFRRSIYPDYKRNRKTSEEKALIQKQVNVLREILFCFGTPQICVNKLEADDIIAVLTCFLKGSTVIVSGDKDLAQLVGTSPADSAEETVMYYLPKKQLISHGNFEEVMGVPLERFVDYKILVGDRSDNIPGIKGIGKKTALEVIKAIPDIFEPDPKNLPSRAKGLTKHQDVLLRNYRLMDLLVFMGEYSDAVMKHVVFREPDIPRFHNTLIKYGLQSLLKQVENWIEVFV